MLPINIAGFGSTFIIWGQKPCPNYTNTEQANSDKKMRSLNLRHNRKNTLFEIKLGLKSKRNYVPILFIIHERLQSSFPFSIFIIYSLKLQFNYSLDRVAIQRRCRKVVLNYLFPSSCFFITGE